MLSVTTAFFLKPSRFAQATLVLSAISVTTILASAHVFTLLVATNTHFFTVWLSAAVLVSSAVLFQHAHARVSSTVLLYGVVSLSCLVYEFFVVVTSSTAVVLHGRVIELPTDGTDAAFCATCGLTR